MIARGGLWPLIPLGHQCTNVTCKSRSSVLLISHRLIDSCVNWLRKLRRFVSAIGSARLSSCQRRRMSSVTMRPPVKSQMLFAIL